ncbi:hypothetical protein BJ508DRAFT_310804 [Ascobolus immersus RN42]|uniref:Uncharacterized protein n=1 Tax=Ascobolus immersus RN42 TaxID=1160509 RepID=A0A3N4HXU3_ASCIM|nr:hypothetical protein BJ508DRAFT_310804 [Ascobolus immersus RN42]
MSQTHPPDLPSPQIPEMLQPDPSESSTPPPSSDLEWSFADQTEPDLSREEEREEADQDGRPIFGDETLTNIATYLLDNSRPSSVASHMPPQDSSTTGELGEDTFAAIERITGELDNLTSEFDLPHSDAADAQSSRTVSALSISSFPAPSELSSDAEDEFDLSNGTVGLRESEEVAEQLSKQVFSLKLDLLCRDRKIAELQHRLHELQGGERVESRELIRQPPDLETADHAGECGGECREVMARVMRQIETRDELLVEIADLITKMKDKLEHPEAAGSEGVMHMQPSASSSMTQREHSSSPRKQTIQHSGAVQHSNTLYQTPFRNQLRDAHEYTPASLWTDTSATHHSPTLPSRRYVPISSRRTSVTPHPSEHLHIASRLPAPALRRTNRINTGFNDRLDELGRLHGRLSSVIEEGYTRSSNIGLVDRRLASPLQMRPRTETRTSSGSREDVWCYLASPKKETEVDEWSTTTKVAGGSIAAASSSTVNSYAPALSQAQGRSTVDGVMGIGAERRGRYTPGVPSMENVKEGRKGRGRLLSYTSSPNTSGFNRPNSATINPAQQLNYRRDIRRTGGLETEKGVRRYTSIEDFARKAVAVRRLAEEYTGPYPHEWRQEMVSRDATPPRLRASTRVVTSTSTKSRLSLTPIKKTPVRPSSRQTPKKHLSRSQTPKKFLTTPPTLRLPLGANLANLRLSPRRSRIPVRSPPQKIVRHKRKSLNLHDENSLSSPSRSESVSSYRTAQASPQRSASVSSYKTAMASPSKSGLVRSFQTALTRNESYQPSKSGSVVSFKTALSRNGTVRSMASAATTRVSPSKKEGRKENVRPVLAMLQKTPKASKSTTAPKTPRRGLRTPEQTTARKMMARRQNALLSGGKGLGRKQMQVVRKKGLESEMRDDDDVENRSPEKVMGVGEKVGRLLRFDMW